MKKFSLLVAATTFASSLVACSGGTGQTIEVTGEGKAPLHYDVLIMNVGGQFRAKTSARAAAGALPAAEAMHSALVHEGVAITPTETHPPANFAGAGYWAAFFGFDVRADPSRDIAGLVRVAWAAARAKGAIPTGGWRVELAAVDDAEESAAARSAALRDARVRAKQLATVAGLRLTSLVAVDEVPLGALPKASLGLSGEPEAAELDLIAPFVKREQDQPKLMAKLRVRFAAR
jgi:uncharacterized protein YggE